MSAIISLSGGPHDQETAAVCHAGHGSGHTPISGSVGSGAPHRPQPWLVPVLCLLTMVAWNVIKAAPWDAKRVEYGNVVVNGQQVPDAVRFNAAGKYVSIKTCRVIVALNGTCEGASGWYLISVNGKRILAALNPLAYQGPAVDERIELDHMAWDDKEWVLKPDELQALLKNTYPDLELHTQYSTSHPEQRKVTISTH